jgi:hypothetical protein
MLAQGFLDNLRETLEAGPQNTSDIQSFLLCMGAAVVFGVSLNLLYKLYFRDNEPQDGSLARSLMLLTPALSATFWIIQSSVILSLGLLGSLSFVRYRTPVKRSEDVTFIVIALAVAISCATLNFLIATALMGFLFGFTLLRNLTGIAQSRERFAIVTFNTRKTHVMEDMSKIFHEVGVKAEFVSSRTYDGITSLVFNAPKVTQEKHDRITTFLSQLDHQASFNIFYPNERLGV